MARGFDRSLVVKEVPEEFLKRVEENMDVHYLGLYDAFKEAAEHFGEPGSEIYKAWYYDDYRMYIPSAYLPEFLDFGKYPLKYS